MYEDVASCSSLNYNADIVHSAEVTTNEDNRVEIKRIFLWSRKVTFSMKIMDKDSLASDTRYLFAFLFKYHTD